MLHIASIGFFNLTFVKTVVRSLRSGGVSLLERRLRPIACPLPVPYLQETGLFFTRTPSELTGKDSIALITGSVEVRIAKFTLSLWPLIPIALIPHLMLAVALNRRSRRRAKGLCLACGYDLTGNTSGVCPECGPPANQHHQTAQISPDVPPVAPPATSRHVQQSSGVS
jgi:hypothetical protein